MEWLYFDCFLGGWGMSVFLIVFLKMSVFLIIPEVEELCSELIQNDIQNTQNDE